MVRTATCACGRLSVRCEGEPAKISLCHCVACQKRTGSAFGVAVFYPRGAVTPMGAAVTFTRPSDSGFDIDFHFCPTCGSTVFWEPRRKPDMVAVALGAFGDPTFPAPTQAVYDETRHPWAPRI